MQSIPLAVLKQIKFNPADCLHNSLRIKLHAIHTACGIETFPSEMDRVVPSYCMQSIPLAVLKKERFVQKIPKSMKRSPAAEPQGLFCRYMYAVFLAVYVSFEQRQRFLERRPQILCLAGLAVSFFLHDVPHDRPRAKTRPDAYRYSRNRVKTKRLILRAEPSSACSSIASLRLVAARTVTPAARRRFTRW